MTGQPSRALTNEEAQEIETEADKKKRSSKHKWVPFEIDISKGGKKDSTSKQKPGDTQSTVSEGDRDWRELREGISYGSRYPRPNSAAPRGRGRNRGGRRAPFTKPTRMPADSDFSDYLGDYNQVIFSFQLFKVILTFTPSTDL